MTEHSTPPDGPAAISLHAAGKAFALEAASTDGKGRRRSLEQQALRWSYVLRARERWVDDAEARSMHERDALQTLLGFGLTDADIQHISTAPQVVVRMRYTTEAEGWAGRIFPWEYVIAAATRVLRSRAGERFVIVRELVPAGPAAAGHAATAAGAFTTAPRLLYVQSAPGRLGDSWDFDGERERLARVFTGADQLRILKNPTLDRLVVEVDEWKPDIVHFSGFDNVQGLKELRELAGPQTQIDVPSAQLPDLEGVDDYGFIHRTLARLLQDERVLQDGLLMTSPNGRPCVVTAFDLAEALAAASHHAFLAGFSVANSAARTAALLVGEGAALSAVGFQGDIDNAFSDYFFELLYNELAVAGATLPAAFQRSWAKARLQPHARRATGIALWAAFDLAAGSAADGVATALVRKAGDPALDAKPARELNYALLHNNSKGRLFDRFVIERNGAPEGALISAEVEVHLGTEKAMYSKCFKAGKLEDVDRWDLAEEIHVPLTATLVRSVREAVNSSVVVQLAMDGKVLHRDSHRVRLLPVDQWRDNDRDGQWLPSFVLPRDALVMRAVQQAQRYVRVLRDDPTAGFEGYQAAPDEDPTVEEQLVEVDLQAQAIWATLLHDWRLGYINPPPTYSAELDSQRLRTPTTVRSNGAGTCIDLALLFAACLELVDIYPVIFLLEGHALPGYWRHGAYQRDFNAAKLPADNPPVAERGERASSSGIQKHPWQAGRDAYLEIAQCIRTRQLVPIETVRLTENCGFVEAIESGVEALSTRLEFHSMLDIVRARAEGVTPLPIVESTTRMEDALRADAAPRLETLP